MKDVAPARWAGLSKTETIQLQVAKHGLLVSRRQLDALNLFAQLSDRLALRQLSESAIEYSTRLVVEVDGALLIDVDTDGCVGMNGS